MKNGVDNIERMVDILSSLPTIGKKTARRLTYFILKQDIEYANKFSSTLLDLVQNVNLCKVCYNFTELEVCKICQSEKRDKSKICVVEDPSDVSYIDNTNEFSGLFHVLHGVINPLNNINAEDLKIRELINRLQGVDEVIIALNPNVESDITAQYLANLIKPLNIKVTKLASGIPLGTSIEYSDNATISRALEGRVLVR
ncbi:MAG: recombination mediator RecR [Candidatus Kapaibacterium sp.]|nr:recombination protein RecR [Ignavibacteriota bacterium]MCB9220219.1 recombination protein RecR [Ignavibacteria bacterium]